MFARMITAFTLGHQKLANAYFKKTKRRTVRVLKFYGHVRRYLTGAMQ